MKTPCWYNIVWLERQSARKRGCAKRRLGRGRWPHTSWGRSERRLELIGLLVVCGCGGGATSSDGASGPTVSSTSGTTGSAVADGESASSTSSSSISVASATATTGSATTGTEAATSTSGATSAAGGAATSGASSTSASVETMASATVATSTTGVSIPDGAPAPGTYADLATLPEFNSEMAVAEVDGLIYVLGGYPSSRVTQTTVQRYDPLTDSWAIVEPLPVAIHHPVAAGYGGKLYSLGGQTDDGDTDRTLVYDPATDGWTELAPMLGARGAGAAAVIDDQIYVVGGRPPASNAFEVYDVSDDSWTPLPDLPTDYNDRNHLAAAAIGGKVYVAGGRYDGGSFSSPMTDALDVYDPVSGMWTRAASMLRPRGGVNGVAAHGCFHVWGGEGANTGEPNDVFPDHDVYNPLTDEWTSVAPLPTPVHGVTGAAFVNGLIYMPGGGLEQGGSSGSNIFQVYNPEMRCE